MCMGVCVCVGVCMGVYMCVGEREREMKSERVLMPLDLLSQRNSPFGMGNLPAQNFCALHWT